MITTIIPYQQATLYQPAPPVPGKGQALAGATAYDKAKPDSIELSPAAHVRLAKDRQTAETTANEIKSLQEAARRTVAGLQRNQARAFTAQGLEVTDPDTSGTARAVASLRDVKPQPVKITDILA